MPEKLAIEGGTPVRTAPFPSVNDISGRTFGEEEIANLTAVIKSGNLFRHGGQFVPALERDFAELMGVKHAVACTSGTAALHLAVAAVNPDPGDEIITAPITDMGTIAPIIMQNAIPIFADLEPATYTLDPASIEANITPRTKAIIPVHLFGQPADMDAIMAIGRKHGVKVIEDCCQSYLAEYKGRLVGSIGDLGAFSMQQSKHLATGDGGMTVSSDDELGLHARLFMDKGWHRGGNLRDYVHLGINYRMNELTGAVAAAQLGKVRGIVENRRRTARLLTKLLLEGAPGVRPPIERPGCQHSYWQYPFTIDEARLGISPQEFAKAVGAEGVGVGVGYIGVPSYMWGPIREGITYGKSHCPFDCPKASRRVEYRLEDCPNTVEILRTICIIGWNEGLTDQDVADMAAAVGKVARHYAR